jgi:hypothetical protein
MEVDKPKFGFGFTVILGKSRGVQNRAGSSVSRMALMKNRGPGGSGDELRSFEPAPVLVVASSCTVTTLEPTALVDVVTGISRFTVVNDAFTDRGHLVPLGGGLGMN